MRTSKPKGLSRSLAITQSASNKEGGGESDLRRKLSKVFLPPAPPLPLPFKRSRCHFRPLHPLSEIPVRRDSIAAAKIGIPEEIYRDEIYSLQILLSRTQAGPGSTVKQEQEELSPNYVQRLNLISVLQFQIHTQLSASFSTEFASSGRARLSSSVALSFLAGTSTRFDAWLLEDSLSPLFTESSLSAGKQR